jgi:exopolyphosphatase/guanosine-5'-triphosphate,3'-diphosphate pyrophosphatase
MRIRREVPDPRRRSVLDLCRRCEWHQEHSEQVTRLTLRLFDELPALHGLGPLERELLEYAALMHDIGWHIGRRAHHKHSAYLIQHGKLRDFSPEEVLIMANIARYHRGPMPKRSHRLYEKLPRRAREVVNAGAALLRVADGLDRSHAAVIRDLACQSRPDRVKVVLDTRSDAELEIWGALRKADMFEKVFGRSIGFELQ